LPKNKFFFIFNDFLKLWLIFIFKMESRKVVPINNAPPGENDEGTEITPTIVDVPHSNPSPTIASLPLANNDVLSELPQPTFQPPATTTTAPVLSEVQLAQIKTAVRSTGIVQQGRKKSIMVSGQVNNIHIAPPPPYHP